MDEFKDRLLELIKSKNISASELSKKINVQRSNISHILSGRNKPSLDFVLKLCDYYNDIDLDWLLKGISSSNPIIHKKNRNKTASINKIVLFFDDGTFETFSSK